MRARLCHARNALALVALLACARGDERLVASGRVGGPDGRAAGPPLPTSELTLAQVTRDSVGDALGREDLELDVREGDRGLRFSLARKAPEDCRASLVFSIAGHFEAGWRPLFSEVVEPGEPHWLDRELGFDAGERPARLRLAARATASDCVPEVEAYWGSLVFLGRAPPQPEPPPNLLLISLDTLGADYLGSFGNAREVSPHLDAFLASGFDFRRAYAQYGYTLPSHASLFSGLQPLRHGVYLPNPGVHFDSLVGALARRGYVTAAFTEGAMLSASFGFARGFDWYEEGPPSLPEQLAGGAARTFDRAATWLETSGRSLRFFLFVHTYEVHLPYIPRDAESRAVARLLTPGVARFFRAPMQMIATWRHNRGIQSLSPRELEHLRALYSAEINYLDRQLAGLLERLAAAGLENDTLVVVTSDHGDQFGEHGKVSHGESLHNRVLHVPLAFRWPGHIEPGRSEMPVQLIDVMPTLFELAGLEVPADLDGRSLAPLLRGETLEPRPAISEQRHGRGECVRQGRPEWCRLDRMAIQDGRFKLLRMGPEGSEALYDLREDPLEERDVAAEHPEVVQRLGAELDAQEARRAPEPSAPRAPAPPPPELQQLLERLGYAR